MKAETKKTLIEVTPCEVKYFIFLRLCRKGAISTTICRKDFEIALGCKLPKGVDWERRFAVTIKEAK